MILLVEDDAITRVSFAQMLRAHGHQVVEVADGRKALELLSSLRFDLVITDLVLPNLNGLNLVRLIRARCPSLPVILVSAYLSESGGRTILGESAHFFQKPVRPSALLATAQRLLGSRN